MNLARRPGLDHQPGLRAQAAANQVLMNGGGGQKRGNRHSILVNQPIRDDHDVKAALDSIGSACAQCRDTRLNTLSTPARWVSDIELKAAELVAGVNLDVTHLCHRVFVEHWLRNFQPQRRVDIVDVKQIGLGTYE